MWRNVQVQYSTVVLFKKKMKKKTKHKNLNLAAIGWTGEADCGKPAVAQPASLFKQLSKSAAAELGEKGSSQVCKPSLLLRLQSDGIENVL